jgi:hypothetical protein
VLIEVFAVMRRQAIVCEEQILQHVDRQASAMIVIVIVMMIAAAMSASGLEAAATVLAHRDVLARF